MPPFVKYVLDAVAGGALLFALLVVFVVDRFTRPTEAPIVNTLTVNVAEAGKRKDAKPLKLAVTPTGSDKNALNGQIELWDDMGKLLEDLGKGYKYERVETQQFLNNPKKIGEYDVVFLTCAGGGEELKDVLRDYVSNGGILYASDWRYEAVAAAFPDMIDNNTRDKGESQQLEADIVDAALREVIGNKIHLKFDLGDWKTAGFGGPRVKTLIRGTYKKQNGAGQTANAPLMVKFAFGKGTVIFTSFHNEKQNSEVEKKLLQYLVFSLVTAGLDAEINDKMNELGFTPQRSNLLSTPNTNQSVSKEYQHKEPGTLRFTLGFRDEGAKLRFNIKSPDTPPKEYTWEGGSTVSLEVPNAKAGTWTYTVTSLERPYENFPFTVTVGAKK